MKFNPWVILGLIVSWGIVFTLLIELHWRPARVMLPFITIILLVYLVICTIYTVLQALEKTKEEEMKNAELRQNESGADTTTGDKTDAKS